MREQKTGDLAQTPESSKDIVAKSKKYLAQVAVYTALAAPFAALYGISTAEIDDPLGPNKAHYEVTTKGNSNIITGLPGDVTLPINFGTFGIDSTVKGIPINNSASSGELEIPFENIGKQYVAAYDNGDDVVEGIKNQLFDDAKQRVIRAEIITLLGSAVVVAGGALALRENISKRLTLSKLEASGIIIAELAAMGAFITRPAEIDQSAYAIHALDGTSFEGATTKDLAVAVAAERLFPTFLSLKSRQERMMTDFQDTAYRSIEEQTGLLSFPEENEDVFMTTTDEHCSYAMMPVLKSIASSYKPEVLVSAGDNTNFGSAAEEGCIEGLSAIMQEAGDTAVAGGNHDSKTTEKQIKKSGIKALDGKTVEINGTTILGDDDPEITPPFSSGYRIADRNETEQEMGQRLLEQAKKEHPDIIVAHQPDAVQPVIDYSKSIPSEKIASLIFNGHLHSEVGPNVFWNEDGTWTVQYQGASAGGNGTATLTSISTPISTPLKPAETMMFYKNKVSRLITGYQRLVFSTDGKLTVSPRVNVGTSTGQPLEASHNIPAAGKSYIKVAEN